MKTTKSVLQICAGLALAGALALSSGCWLVAAGAAGAAGAGAVAYVRGELEASLGSNYDAVVRASDLAITQMQFAKISEQKDALSAKIVARTAQDKKVSIAVSKVSETLTKVQIRIGVIGDEAVSLAVLDKIKANL